MSRDIKIELVGGCEGDCLVMNDYRIAGPKPWGGGRIKQTFYTTEGDILTACKFKELAKVKKQLAIAVEALEKYAEEDNWEDCHAGFLDNPIDYGCYGYYGYQQAQEALLKIKELDK